MVLTTVYSDWCSNPPDDIPNSNEIFANILGIHPTQCDPFFKNIVSCMADGKNHVPCCERNNIPDICQDMGVGEYTEQTDDVRTHLSCGSFTAPTLACISEGVGKTILFSTATALELVRILLRCFQLWNSG